MRPLSRPGLPLWVLSSWLKQVLYTLSVQEMGLSVSVRQMGCTQMIWYSFHHFSVDTTENVFPPMLSSDSAVAQWVRLSWKQLDKKLHDTYFKRQVWTIRKSAVKGLKHRNSVVWVCLPKAPRANRALFFFPQLTERPFLGVGVKRRHQPCCPCRSQLRPDISRENRRVTSPEKEGALPLNDAFKAFIKHPSTSSRNKSFKWRKEPQLFQGLGFFPFLAFVSSRADFFLQKWRKTDLASLQRTHLCETPSLLL